VGFSETFTTEENLWSLTDDSSILDTFATTR